MEYPKHNCCLTFERTSKDFCNIKNCFTEEEWDTETKYAYLLKAFGWSYGSL